MTTPANDEGARTQLEFLARRGHGLRTPLNVILGFSELLLSDESAPLPPHQRAQVERIQQAGEALLGQLQDLTDHARLQLGTLAVRQRPFEARAVLTELLQAVQPLAVARGVRIECEMDLEPDRPVELTGDPDRFGQVVRRLLANAIRFSPTGAAVQLRAYRHAGQLAVDVADAGDRLTAAQRPLLFEPLAWREREAAGLRGSGVGLAVARGVARAMGGDLSLAPGPGCRMALRLPLARGAAG